MSRDIETWLEGYVLENWDKLSEKRKKKLAAVGVFKN